MEKHVQQTLFHKGNAGKLIQKQTKSSAHDGLPINRLLPGRPLLRSKEKANPAGSSVPTIMVPTGAEKREENINYAVKQIFTNYPPKAK